MDRDQELPQEWEESYNDAMSVAGELIDGVVVDHYEKELYEFLNTLPSSARGKYTMQSLTAIKQHYTAKEFMWLSPDERLNLFKYGVTNGPEQSNWDWED